MEISRITEPIDEAPGLAENGLKAARSLHDAVLRGGTPARRAADVLHGTWMGHPLHPMLTDVTIGAWMAGGFLDLLAAVRRDPALARAADRLTEAGLLSAVPTALSGLADFSTIPKPAAGTATLHALVNDINVLLYALSVRERRRRRRGRGVFFSATALGLSMFSAWLGGHMVYAQKVGVDHAPAPEGPDAWTPVAGADALAEGRPLRVEAGGVPVLLYRSGDALYAIGATCPHAGAPLDEGAFDGDRVTCPWHDSVFDLRNGGVVHGPATCAVSVYDTRLADGRVEIRLRKA